VITFKARNPPEEIANEFGYQFGTQILDFSTNAKGFENSDIKKLQAVFYENLPKISLNSEMAKREFMIAPLLWEIIRHVLRSNQCRISDRN
jgi:hypothetical protein